MYGINRFRPRHMRPYGRKYSKYKEIGSQHNDTYTIEAQFMKKLSNIEADLKKAFLIKKELIDLLFYQ